MSIIAQSPKSATAALTSITNPRRFRIRCPWHLEEASGNAALSQGVARQPIGSRSQQLALAVAVTKPGQPRFSELVSLVGFAAGACSCDQRQALVHQAAVIGV